MELPFAYIYYLMYIFYLDICTNFLRFVELLN